MGAPGRLERITDPAAVPAGFLLDALAASVQRIAGQGDNVKRVHHRDCVEYFSAMSSSLDGSVRCCRGPG